MATFHFLHHLANMKFGRANVVSSVITGGIGTGGSSVASGSAFGIGKGGAGSGGAAVSIASSNAASTKVIFNIRLRVLVAAICCSLLWFLLS